MSTRRSAAAAAAAEHHVVVDTAHQGYLEPQAVVAEADPSGAVTVWASTQGAFQTEVQLAGLLGMPQSQIKVVPLEVGGAFGGKIVHARRARGRAPGAEDRPAGEDRHARAEKVMVGTRAGGRRGRSRCASAPTAKGSITAIDGRYYIDTGGIPGTATTLLMQASAAPYQCDNLRLEGFDVVTNKPRTEAYRGPGGIQAAFAMEQAIDMLAQKLASRSAGAAPAQRGRHGQHHADRHAVPADRADHDPRSRGGACLSGPTRSARASFRAGVAWRSATGAARP